MARGREDVVQRATSLAARSPLEAIALLEGASEEEVGASASSTFDAAKLLGNLHFLMENYEQAHIHYVKAVSAAKADSSCNLVAVAHIKGRIHFIAGRFKQALDVFRETTASTTFKSHVGAMFDLATCAGACGQFDEADAAFQKTLEMSKFDESISCMCGRKWLAWGTAHRHRARQVLEQCISRKSQKAPRALGMLGQIKQDDGDYVAAKRHYSASLALHDDAKMWYNMGTALAEDPSETFDAAVGAYQRAVELDSGLTKAWLNLGHSYKAIAMRELGFSPHATPDKKARKFAGRQLELARRAFARVVSDEGSDADADADTAERSGDPSEVPEVEAARHGLAVVQTALLMLDGSPDVSDLPTPGHAPLGYLLQEFEGAAADTFNHRLLMRLNYTSHDELAAQLAQHYSAMPDPMLQVRSVLDLGCGTGLTGTALRHHPSGLFHACAMDGVDVSPTMCSHAAHLDGIYRAVHNEDITTHMTRLVKERKHYDLIVSTDVFIYIGALERIFDLATQLLDANEGGVFAMTMETLDATDTADFRLLLSGRYAHSPRYIRALAEERQLVAKMTIHSPRIEGGTEVPGQMWLMQKVEAH